MSSQEFGKFLSMIGYPGVKAGLKINTDYLFENENLAPFLTWMCNNITLANVVTSDQIAKFRALENSGQEILRVEQLESCGISPEKDEKITAKELQVELKRLEHQLNNYEKQLRVLRISGQQMRDHVSRAKQEIAALNMELIDAKQKLECSKIGVQMAVSATTTKLQSIDGLLQNISLHLKTFPLAKSGWMCGQDSDLLLQTSQKCVESIQNELQKRFSVKTTAEVDKHAKLQQELQVIQKCLPCRETKLFEKHLEYRGLQCSEIAASKMLSSLKSHIFCSSTNTLREMLANASRRVQELSERYGPLREEVAQQICSLAFRKANFIVEHEYSAKLDRLHNSVATLEKAIRLIVAQFVTIYVPSASVNIEKKYFISVQATVNDVAATVRANSHKEEVMSLSESGQTVYPIKDGETLNFIRELLGKHGDRDTPTPDVDLLSYVQQHAASLHKKDETLKSQLDSALKSMMSQAANMDTSLRTLKSVVWSDCNSYRHKPLLTPKEITRSLSAIEKMTDAIRGNLSAAMDERQTKQKMLSSDKILQLKRALYTYFYTNEASLKRAVGVMQSRSGARGPFFNNK